MKFFPETSTTLLRTLCAEATGERESAWTRFFDLYTPAIRSFVEAHDETHDPDDVVQDVFVKIADVIKRHGYSRERGTFRSFLITLIRRHLISLYRKDQARCTNKHVPLDGFELAVPAEVIEQIDLKWRLACHASAIEHVLTKTAISEQSKQVYRAYVQQGRSLKEVMGEFGLTKAAVYKIKSRIEQMAALVEKEFTGE